MGGPTWSDEEKAILQRIYDGDTTIIESAHLLPRRSLRAIRQRISETGLEPRGGKSRSHFRWVEIAVFEALRQHGPLHCHQIASLIGASSDHVRAYAYKAHGLQQTHISGWCRLYDRGSNTPIWALGHGEDAPKPAKQTRAEKYRKDSVRRKAQRGTLNPFLAAAGLVQAPASAPGRVYKQSMSINDEEVAA
jgi:hypothetical protein